MSVSIYVETYSHKFNGKTISSICGEAHKDRSMICSESAMLGIRNTTLATIAEIARLLEEVKRECQDPKQTDVSIYTTNDAVVWGWDCILSQLPKTNQRQWKRLQQAIRGFRSVSIKGSGILSRSVRDKAKLYLTKRVEFYVENDITIRCGKASR